MICARKGSRVFQIHISPTSDVLECSRITGSGYTLYPSGEGQSVRKEVTVQVEQWWNSSDVPTSLGEENVWDTDDTVLGHPIDKILLSQ